MATTDAKKEALYVGQFLVALRYRLFNQPISLKANNRKTILLTINPEFYSWNKYIEIQYY